MKTASEIPEKPLTAGIHNKVEQAQRVYFFEREDKTTFFAREQEAWTIMKGRNQTLGQLPARIKFIGSSDGILYRNAVLESQELFKTHGLAKAQERLRQGEAEELEAARGKMIYPRNFDTITQGGSPINLNEFK